MNILFVVLVHVPTGVVVVIIVVVYTYLISSKYIGILFKITITTAIIITINTFTLCCLCSNFIILCPPLSLCQFGI